MRWGRCEGVGDGAQPEEYKQSIQAKQSLHKVIMVMVMMFILYSTDESINHNKHILFMFKINMSPNMNHIYLSGNNLGLNRRLRELACTAGIRHKGVIK